MKKTKNKQGTILIELLIAMAIFVVGTVAILSLFAAGTQGVLTGLENTKGSLLSNQALEAAYSISRSDQDYLRPGKYEVGISENNQWVLIPRTGLMGHFLLANNAEDLGPHKNQTTMLGISFAEDRKEHPLAAAKFNGATSYIKTVHALPLQIEGPLTLSAWVLDTHPNEEETRIIAGKKGAYVLYQENKEYFFEISGQEKTTTIKAESDYRNWEHVVAVYDPGRGDLKLYINGKEKNSEPTTITKINKVPEMEFFIGAEQGDLNFWHGRISDVRVYNRSLTSKEIAGLYRSYSVPNQKSLVVSSPKNLITVWSFNEGEGCIAHDNSQNNNHAIIKECFSDDEEYEQWTDNRHSKEERAVGFNQNSYLEIKDSSALQLEEKISVSLWIKLPKDLLEGEEDIAILYKRAAGSADLSFSLIYGYDEETGVYGFSWAVSRGQGSLEQIITRGPVIPDRWQHIVATFDGNNRKIYIDNRQITDLDQKTVSIDDTSSDLFIGINATDQTSLAGAAIDDLRIYDEALGSAEIQTIFLGIPNYYLE